MSNGPLLDKTNEELYAENFARAMGMLAGDRNVDSAFRRIVAGEADAPVEQEVALNVKHPKCHEAANAFWDYWKANGETHKHGYYESTWGAINAALRLVGTVPHTYGTSVQIARGDLRAILAAYDKALTYENTTIPSMLMAAIEAARVK